MKTFIAVILSLSSIQSFASSVGVTAPVGPSGSATKSGIKTLTAVSNRNELVCESTNHGISCVSLASIEKDKAELELMKLQIKKLKGK
jgi:hypothetical protein